MKCAVVYYSKTGVTKRIIPFATASATGKESSLKTLKALLTDSSITDYLYTSSRQPADIQTWLDGIK